MQDRLEVRLAIRNRPVSFSTCPTWLEGHQSCTVEFVPSCKSDRIENTFGVQESVFTFFDTSQRTQLYWGMNRQVLMCT